MDVQDFNVQPQVGEHLLCLVGVQSAEWGRGRVVGVGGVGVTSIKTLELSHVTTERNRM